MIVVIKIMSHLLFRYDVDLLVVSFDSTPKCGSPLRVIELAVDAECDLPLFEP